MDQNELIDLITKNVMEKINTQLPHVVQSSNNGPASDPMGLAKYIDHTLLKPDASDQQFDQLCDEALRYEFKSVCVNSQRVTYVKKRLRNSKVLVCAVVGFPLGQMDSRAKAFEARRCIEDGAAEIDMVINVGQLKSGKLKEVEDDIRAVRRATRKSTVLKVIIETSLLTDDEKVIACQLSQKAGADFVKTSTGFSGGGATSEDIALMRRTVGPDMGVKASGGIRDTEGAMLMLKSGANRIGAGAGVAIAKGGKGSMGY
jgi:deoxyribose-phosphate aldolase